MSLLMDALKKAEKARRERLERERQAGALSDTQELRLDPLDAAPARAEEERRDERGAPLEFDLEHTGEAPAVKVDPALEPAERAAAETPPEEEREEEPLREREPEGDARLSLVEDDDFAFDDTSATLPSLKTARASVDRYFDDSPSQSMERIAIERPAPPDGATTITGRRVAADRAAQRAAQSVFTAKSPRVSRVGRSWIVLFALVALFIGVAWGGYVYWKALMGGPSLVRRSPIPRPEVHAAPRGPLNPSPSPSPGSSPSPAPPPAPAPEASRTAAAGAAPASSSSQGDSAGSTGPGSGTAAGGAPAGAASAGSMQAAAPVPAFGTFTAGPPAAGNQAGAGGAEIPSGREPAAEATLNASGAGAGTAVTAGGAEEALLPPGVPPASRISISRRSAPDRVRPGLAAAYAAYQRGNDSAARSAYRKVLAAERNNRDALLGLAAIAVRGQHYKEAEDLYVRLLRRDPRDPVAQAALIGLNGRRDPVAGESRIKLLLERYPDASYLHFGLGNLYAAQSRWGAAQAQYFNAYVADNGNADYALNLAVSLDHLGKRTAALSYYRRALELAERHQAGFEPAAVRERIRLLAGSPQAAAGTASATTSISASAPSTPQ